MQMNQILEICRDHTLILQILINKLINFLKILLAVNVFYIYKVGNWTSTGQVLDIVWTIK